MRAPQDEDGFVMPLRKTLSPRSAAKAGLEGCGVVMQRREIAAQPVSRHMYRWVSRETQDDG